MKMKVQKHNSFPGILLLVVSLFLSLAAFSQKIIYPSYETVFKLFHAKYDYEPKGLRDLFFAKKKDGWFVYEADQTSNVLKPLNEQLLWSSSTGKYYVVKFPIQKHRPGADEINSLYEAHASNEYNYKCIPYYGYSGWDKDVIADFGNKSGLSDSLLEGLARAYSNYSMAFLWNQYNFMSEVEGQKEIPSTENYSKDRIDNFIKYTDLGIETYHKLAKLNPRYETMVGNSFAKYSNEIVYKYSTLCIAGRYDLAKGCLKPGLFSPMLMAMAKNYLNSVAPNGILFTDGDNDTYPLWYVQETENYRKDVTVINSGLLNLTRYIIMLKRGSIPGSKPIKMAWDEKIALSDTFAYALIDASAEGKIYSINSLIKQLSEEKSIKITEGKQTLYAPGVKYFIKAPENEIMYYKVLGDTDKDNIVPEMKFSIGGGYIIKGDIVTLDIIAENAWQRPIYFSITSPGVIPTALGKYFQNEGLAYRLLPKNISSESEDEEKFINSTLLYKNLMEKFTWAEDVHEKPQKDVLSLGMEQNLKNIYMSLVDKLIDEQKTSLAGKVIDHIYAMFPPDVYPYSIEDLRTADAFFKLEEFDKAYNILDQTVKNEEEKFNKATAEEKSSALDNYKKTLDYAASLTESKGLTMKSKKFKDMLDKVNLL